MKNNNTAFSMVAKTLCAHKGANVELMNQPLLTAPRLISITERNSLSSAALPRSGLLRCAMGNGFV